MIKDQEKTTYYDLIGRIALILLPFCLILILSIKDKRSLFDLLPYINDEIDYWRELYSFDQCLLSFGKYGWLGYRTAKIGSLGCHGISEIFAWGWYPLLFPWKANSIYIANFILLTLAYIVFVILIKPNLKLCALIFFFSLSFRPLNAYMNSSLMEIPCTSFLFLCISLILSYQKRPQSKTLLYLCLISTVYCSLLRICYIVVLLPIIMISNDYKIDRRLIPKVLFLFICFIASYLISSWTSAEYPISFLNSISKNDLPLSDKLIMIINWFFKQFSASLIQIYSGFVSLFSKYASLAGLRSLFFDSFPRQLFIVRLFYYIVMFYLLFSGLRKQKHDKLAIYMFIMLLGFVIGITALYETTAGKDVRIMSPLLYAVIIWIIVSDYTNKSNHRSKIIIILLFITSIIISLISLPSQRIKIDTERYEYLADHLQDEDQDSISLQIELYDHEYGLSLASCIPARYGILFFDDVSEVNKNRPKFVLSAQEISNGDYKLLGGNPQDGFLYELQQ